MDDGPRAVLFDFGGVILQEQDALYDAFGVARGLAPGRFYERLYEGGAWEALRTGRIRVEAWREACVERLRPHWGDDTEAELRSWWRRPLVIHEATLDLARELKARGVRIGVVSNAAKDLVEDMTSKYGIDVAWDLVLPSGLAGCAKPDPRIFRMAADRIGVPVSRCFFVDDRTSYLEGAVAVGMPHHHFQGDYEALRADLRAAGYPV
ncbi:MAG: HAD family hydrolase [Planctomycetota bacterium]|jgi:putative hydrolase of the HAD superfamily